jgi:CubicO group peptidase (beta-lactamase class C family)
VKTARPVLAAGALALGCLSGPARAQPAGLAPARLEAVERAVTATMARLGVPGLSLAFGAGDRVEFTNGYGAADLENFVPAKASTVYRFGSVSKPITATAVLQLAEKGRLDLDAPIQAYVAPFPVKPWPVTARQLLGHLGGIRHYAGEEFQSTRRYERVLDALDIFKDDPLAHEPGTKYLYTTYGYNLLGAAVEGASGRSFMDYLRENVLGPAGMRDTGPDDVLALIPNRAQGYARPAHGELRNSGLTDTSNKLPGAGLRGTAADVARFGLALQGGVLLQKETFARMTTPQRTRDGRPTSYGLGLTLNSRRGFLEAWHTGGQQRVSTILYLRPERGQVVAVLSNLEGAGEALVELARQVADSGPR